MKLYYKILFLICTVCLINTCDSTNPKLEPELTLKIEDVSCTEAWLQLTTNNLQLPATINLLKNNVQSKVFVLNTQDSLLYIDSLLPNQTYKFVTTMQQLNNRSNELSVTTMDTTSHNFTWQTFEFGQHSSSVLYDVAIINENNIWAVGEIYMNDSLGNPDPKAYNAVNWDGNQWELKRIKYYGICSAVEYPPLKAVWAFSETNIVITNGGSIGWFNGATISLDCRVNPLLTGAIKKLWGRSSNDLYIVGNNGNIANYNGSSWTKIESGTKLDIYDIWGNYNAKENKWDILAVAAKRAVNFEKKILRISGTAIVSLPVLGIPYSIQAIWFSGKNHYVVGSGLFRKYDINSPQSWKALHPGITNYHLNDISANGLNDIIICGDFGELLHFNGVTWKSYQESFSGILLGEITMQKNLFVTVGYNSNKAFIALGRRF